MNIDLIECVHVKLWVSVCLRVHVTNHVIVENELKSAGMITLSPSELMPGSSG
ncbi:hypothetical protein HanPI659440_Chr03g0131751 [Helianthus annuus]|nr:hypothetical protein HanPI659440_Chr03g0131751 [Helianthus annuus]